MWRFFCCVEFNTTTTTTYVATKKNRNFFCFRCKEEKGTSKDIDLFQELPRRGNIERVKWCLFFVDLIELLEIFGSTSPIRHKEKKDRNLVVISGPKQKTRRKRKIQSELFWVGDQSRIEPKTTKQKKTREHTRKFKSVNYHNEVKTKFKPLNFVTIFIL